MRSPSAFLTDEPLSNLDAKLRFQMRTEIASIQQRVERVASRELEELASDAGASDLPQDGGSQLTARLDAASQVKQGQETELWFNTEHVHRFDPESGQTLLGSNGNGAAAT